jgi:hypothetical protein
MNQADKKVYIGRVYIDFERLEAINLIQLLIHSI